MKKLTKFALNVDRSAWGNDFGYAFYLKSRCLCNYIERHIKKSPVELINSTKLVISGSDSESTDFIVNSSSIGCLAVPFDKEMYDKSQNDDDMKKFIVRFTRENIINLPDSPCQEIDKILNVIDEFSDSGYVNQWVHQKKSSKKQKLLAVLDCSLTMRKFTLRLTISHEGSTVYSKVILETDPDELAFHSKFKDIKIEEDRLIVTARNGPNLFEVLLEEICAVPT